ncbi:hypothetical protein IFU40_06300 [Microbacterium sp. CFBP 13617]|uniref:hypothetical protein n=1 Tax=Microbacterium sp. CFBP 13617 TaxID=2774035 RepID=UPI0017864E35|nr:hypothetical protein [Microbacterium sp. CFBP 13617]MBD8218244.1 hypothetical protein [Microbacterium sp. CFBP 13617]
MNRIRDDHGLAEAQQESAWWSGWGDERLGVSAKQGYRAGWWAAVQWVLNTQQAIDDLTTGELLAELRKEAGSVYWPLLAADPTFWADCPRCRVEVLIDKQGLCPTCTHEFEEGN